MSWQEGRVTDAEYANGSEALYLSDRLVSLHYNIPEKKRPRSVVAALEMFGLPARAALLDPNDESGFRAFDAPNPEYRHPLRCCGLSFHMVQFPSDFSEIWVNYININNHFVCWPEEMKTAWRKAGMPEPAATGDTRVRVGPIPTGGTILDAPFIHDDCQ